MTANARVNSLWVRGLLLGTLACSACGKSETVVRRITVPAGATFAEVSDTLVARGVVGSPTLLRWYARLRGADRRVQPGTYDLPAGGRWSDILDLLVAGRSVGAVFTMPKGSRIADVAATIGQLVGMPADSVAHTLLNPSLADSLGVPGPTLEGYLYPDTYLYGGSPSLQELVEDLVHRYRAVWTPARRARLDSMGLSERALVTLASIVRAETPHADELPKISAVFHSRLRKGMLLQADVTVRYALPPGATVRNTDIDSLVEHSYNTYSFVGLPPGPIGSPDEAAIDAALHPAVLPYLYFVAGPDGRSEFSRTFAEHRQAIERFRAEVTGSGRTPEEPEG